MTGWVGNRCLFQARSSRDMMAPPDVGSRRRGVTRGPDIFVFWVQPVLLHLDTCSSPADNPEPEPGPVAQPVVLWRPRAHNSGCAAAVHHWGHGHHLEAAPGPHCSSIQGRRGTSLVVQWLRIYLAMQGIWVRFQVREQIPNQDMPQGN